MNIIMEYHFFCEKRAQVGNDTSDHWKPLEDVNNMFKIYPYFGGSRNESSEIIIFNKGEKWEIRSIQ
jgi:hypothetical protein